MKIALILVLTYACSVLVMRYRRDGMDWEPALLIGLLVTPLVLLLSWGRDRLMDGARRAGERARDRRRAAR
ncbi:hypothetical protein GCM10010261_33040 [Streptomyces pilosus]|uniref:Uncharacterized protein n=2 Tax=Streptomyces pilosus TaxID=28893 RepID=A0A918BRE8_9ACTN|nr:hypothetical protein GCM10010280_35050 [Streptomyces pilosus]GGV52558.1 hypothetical protein GCM10010261_33040 [Streptomyces pilosus]